MHVDDSTGRVAPAFVPPRATRRPARAADPIANRYGVLGALQAADVDPNRIAMYYDEWDNCAYWIVTLDGGRQAVLTDDTEEHVCHMEGPWPFKAMLISPDGVRTVIEQLVEVATARFITWCTR